MPPCLTDLTSFAHKAEIVRPRIIRHLIGNKLCNRGLVIGVIVDRTGWDGDFVAGIRPRDASALGDAKSEEAKELSHEDFELPRAGVIAKFSLTTPQNGAALVSQPRGRAGAGEDPRAHGANY